MEKENDQNWIHISKHIIEIVDLKFSKVEDKFKAMDEALTLREINVRKELDHLNNLRKDYEAKKVQDALDFVKAGEYHIQHDILIKKVEFTQKMLYIGLGILLAIEFILRYLKVSQ